MHQRAAWLISFVLLGASGMLAAADTPVEPTLPQMQVAKSWLEVIDAGHYGQAWNDADPTLRKKGDLEKWTREVDKGRGTTAAVKCRRGLDFELLSDPDRINALFLTEFSDGRVISERVTLIDDANEVAHVSAYRSGPPLHDRGPACANP